jgi:hypothetical protein
MEPAWGASWAWGLSLIALTMMAHALGVVMIALWLERLAAHVLGRRHARWAEIVMAAGVFAAVALLLAVLHGIEAGVWAGAYLWLDSIASYREAILFSVDCITTRGAVGAQLGSRWQLLGALEAADGMLLFGVSTAFVFATLQKILPLISNKARAAH